MIDINFFKARKCLEDVEFYLLRLSETNEMSEEEKEERDFTLNELLEAKEMFRICRALLCLKCGKYKKAHIGACDGCGWRMG